MKTSWKEFLTEDTPKTVGVVVCLNDKQQFLIIRRSDVDDRSGQWTMPGGHIDDSDNSIERGALRELYEEVNLTCEASHLKYLGTPRKKKYYFVARKWSGTIDVSKPNPISGKIEHDDYKWATIDEIKEIADTEIPIYLLEKALEISEHEFNF
jgi:8-oxo-dGTP pyrophosphatase MutT (NUDIX family)